MMTDEYLKKIEELTEELNEYDGCECNNIVIPKRSRKEMEKLKL